MRRLLIVASVISLIAAACAGSSATSTSGDASTTSTRAAAPSSSTTAAGTIPVPSSGEMTGVPEPAGAAGLGDPYFPELGNGGYDVDHYTIELAVDPETAEIDAVATIEATATETLATFNLDLLGLEVHGVSVDGPADWVREGPELRISPDGGIVSGEAFTVTVEYSGRPQAVPLVSIGVDFGWTQTPEGIYVAAEPNAARTWFPSNDHPSDKATFTILITVPQPLTGAANGELVETVEDGDSRTFVWEMRDPMATYLATVVVGEYERVESTGPGGIILRDYIPTSFDGEIPGAFEVTGDALELLMEWFGPYPFDRYGHIVVYGLGGALETQTLSLMGSRALFDEVTVHELAHQWFGDSVTPATWQEIWLNEGFATFAEFLWIEERRGTDAMLADIEGRHDTLSSISHNPIFDPQEAELFGPAVYWRGGMTLHALRLAVGDATMKEVLQTYFIRYRHGLATTDDFIAVVDEVTGETFDELWDAWLYQSALPDLPEA